MTLPGEDFRTCGIDVADGVTLTFKNVRVNVTKDTSLIFSGGEATSRLLIQGSTFRACDNDIFGFGVGVQIVESTLREPVGEVCDIMEIEPSGDLLILSSTLRTDTEMELTAPNKVTIQKSILDATNTFPAYGNILIGQAAFGGTTQHVLVEKTTMAADNEIVISAQQDTTVIKNTFRAGSSVTITGDPCTSQSNSPALPCS